MFSDFRYVWQHRGAGPRFRMWVIDEKMRFAGQADESNILFRLTGMNPDRPGTHVALFDYKSITDEQKLEAQKIACDLEQQILQYALKE